MKYSKNLPAVKDVVQFKGPEEFSFGMFRGLIHGNIPHRNYIVFLDGLALRTRKECHSVLMSLK